jgi:hypothetical protein
MHQALRKKPNTYLQLIMVRGHGESSTDLILADRGMLTILGVFGATFAYLIYF